MDDISRIKSLERSKKMADTLNRMSVIFLSNTVETFDKMMTVGMGLIADMADLDRLNVWRNYSAPDGLYATQIYRWDRESGGTTPPVAELAGMSYSKFAPRWEKVLSGGGAINSPVRLIPEGHLLSARGAVSVLITPIFLKGNFWGFVIFSDHRNERYFDDESAEFMRSAAFLSANAIIRAEMDQEIIQAHKFNQAIIRAAPFGLTIFDENSRVIDCNEEILKIFGTSKQHYINNFLEFLPEHQPDGKKTIDKINSIMKRVMTTGETIIIDWLHHNSEGEPVPCELTITSIEHENKYTVVAFVYDLRNIRKMEKEILKAARINQAILDNLPVGMALFDGTPRVINCNDKLVEMFGTTKQHLLDRYYEDFSPEFLPDGRSALEEAYKITNRAITGEKVRIEWPHQTADGVPVPCDLTLTRVEDQDEFIGIGFLYDLRNIKKLTMQLEEALKRATTASEAKSVFLSNMSHEIRTPLNAIIGMTVIGKSAGDMPRKDYCFEKIENASQHLLGVINDVLDMSKIEANKFELSNVEFDFEKTLQRIVNIIAFRADEKKQKLTVHIDKSLPRMLIGDDQRLAQVITNLLGNAVKFTPEEGSIRLETRFLGKEDDVYNVQIKVKDTGIGISPDQHERIFSSFQQADSKTSRKFGGTGLGLVISKNIVELMGGHIELESEVGKGSCFSFTFKAKRGAKKVPRLSDFGINWDNIKIMAVDDDKEVLDYFKDIMQGFGTTCDTALSGKEALALVGINGMYDIFFVDWKMPDMDGIMLARELKARSKTPEHVIVIMISAAEWGSIADEAKKTGVDRFLSKPLFPSSIVDVITEAIGKEHLLNKNSVDINGIFKGCKILLAEDVEINREIVEALVEPTLLEVDCAVNGPEAVDKFEKSSGCYDLILMDVQMPELDGYEATKKIREIEEKLLDNNTAASTSARIPIIAMTANVFREDVEKCLNSGMDDHIGKPLNVDEFFNMLRKYLLS